MRSGKNNVYLIDSTLRDGEQAPGVSFSRQDKLQLAEMLAETGVDELEAGIPAMGQEEMSSIRDIMKLHLPCRITCWCRARWGDIESAYMLKAQSIHISFPVSSIQLRAFGKNEAWVLNKVEELVPAACKIIPNVSVGALDSTRAGISFLRRFAGLASSCGAYRMRIADTVGIASPVKVMSMIRMLSAGSDEMILEFHGHNDLGMATANAICAVMAGAKALSVTVNGLGERAGNAALEEIAVALPITAGKFSNVNTHKLLSLCNFVSQISNRVIPENKPVVGDLMFIHESGIHCNALIKDDSTYQPYPPASIGRKQTEFVLGKHSGSTIICHVLQSNGIIIDRNDAGPLLEKVRKAATEKRKALSDQDLVALYQEHYTLGKQGLS